MTPASLPLHGVTVAIKDLFDITGDVTTAAESITVRIMCGYAEQRQI